ncbi:MAG: hypothetical protein A3A86_03705 [Elusimicrobia bacterium RIFCSPLOWO2_01_FULL_60_11]|nr:MAG: hypothetical protein A3A86_03705 [Elusimicrobia bacterium RIFCSPLOWO2_01_FULL_60_11]
MADFKDKFKGWMGKEPEKKAPEAAKAPANPSSEPSSALIVHREDARKKLAQLSDELAQSRKSMEQEFRRKSEERIRLFAQLAHSDAQAQAMLEQERSKFYRVQKEYEAELETLDATLKKENLALQSAVQEQEQVKTEFLKTSEFKIQEKDLERRRKEQDLEKSLAAVKAQIDRVTEQMEAEQKQWVQRIAAENEQIVALKTQLELKDANRKTQEQKLQQDLARSSQTWEVKIQALEEKIGQERQRRQEELSLRESELRALKLEYDRRESMIRLSLKAKEDEISTARARAESKLKALESETKRMKDQNSSDLKERAELSEKLKVELMLLESQFKVDSEKADAGLRTLQNEAASKISYLEGKLEEEARSGQKAVEDKLSEIQQLDLQSAVRKKQLEEEFHQKRSEVENQRLDLVEKLKHTNQTLEEERAHHRKEIQKRDDAINALKSQMTRNAEELNARREAFARQLEEKKDEIEAKLGQLDERSRLEKEQLINVISQKEQIFSGKKAELAKEQSALEDALKKQEDQLLFEIRPLSNQLNELKGRLEQERSIREKLVRTKEDVLSRLRAQHETLEEARTQEVKEFDQRLAAEAQKAESKIASGRASWRDEKEAIEGSARALAGQTADIEKEIARLPLDVETKRKDALERRNREKTLLEGQLEEVRSRLAEEAEKFRSVSERYQGEEAATLAALEKIRGKAALERKLSQDKADAERAEYERRTAELQREIQKERSDLEQELSGKEAFLQKLRQDFEREKASSENQISSLNEAWQAEQRTLVDDLASLKREYESQKMIWTQAAAERSTQAENLRREIEQADLKLNSTLADYARKKVQAEEEFKRSMAHLETLRVKLQADYAQKIRERGEESVAAQKRLEELLDGARKEKAQVAEEIARQRSELKDRLETAKSELERETQRWPQILSAKDSDIAALKGELALKEATFRSDWEKADKDFEEYRKATGERIQDLQKVIQDERNASEIRVKDLETRIQDLLARQAQEETEARADAELTETEFAKTRGAVEAEIGDIDKKIDLEKKRAEQQIRVKEMEIAALSRDLGQKEIQRNIAFEAHKKEIDQERARLMDWQRALEARLQKERANVADTLKAREEELAAAQDKIRLQKENLVRERDTRTREISETKARLEAKVKELTQQLKDDTRAQSQAIASKGQELEALTEKLNLWTETVRLDEEREQIKWQKEQQSVEAEIQKLQAELEGERTGLDKRIRKQGEEIEALNKELAALQQEYYRCLTDFKDQKAGISAEEESWESKLRDEHSRLAEEARALDRAIERIKVQISLKETQAAIEKQKRDREVLWSRRPFESKLMDLKRKVEEREKDKSRRAQAAAFEKERLAGEIRKFEDQAKAEAAERDKTLARMRQGVQTRLKEIKNLIHQEEAAGKEITQRKRDEIKAFEKILDDIETVIKKPVLVSVDDLREEIALWEKKFEQASQAEPDDSKTEIRDMQQALTEKKKDYEKQRRESEELLSRASSEFERVGKLLGSFEHKAEGQRERSFESRALMESGFATFTTGNYREALNFFSQASQLDPGSAVAHQMQGLIYEKLGQAGLAYRAFRKALELDPENEFLKRHIGG